MNASARISTATCNGDEGLVLSERTTAHRISNGARAQKIKRDPLKQNFQTHVHSYGFSTTLPNIWLLSRYS